MRAVDILQVLMVLGNLLTEISISIGIDEMVCPNIFRMLMVFVYPDFQ